MLWGITLLNFLIMNMAPGDPLSSLMTPDVSISVAEKAKIAHRMGLDQPLPVRYVVWLTNAVQGNFGYKTSYSDWRPVLPILLEAIPKTVELMFLALLVANVMGIGLGILCAVWRYSRTDYILTVFAFFGVSAPGFFVAIGHKPNTEVFGDQLKKTEGGFLLTRLGEDIEFSIRIHSMGFKIGLIPEALVYHKRRTDLIQFYKQLHFFGRARINIYKHFPSELKVVHFFPALFTLFLGLSLIFNVFNHPLADLCNTLLAIYILLIFFHSWNINKSAKVAFLSIAASFVQLSAYGLGFMQDLWKRIILRLH